MDKVDALVEIGGKDLIRLQDESHDLETGVGGLTGFTPETENKKGSYLTDLRSNLHGLQPSVPVRHP